MKTHTCCRSNKTALQKAVLYFALYGATNWNAWRDNIKNQHTNPTSGNVDELFANW